jgi:hypothetical protein
MLTLNVVQKSGLLGFFTIFLKEKQKKVIGLNDGLFSMKEPTR